MNSHGVDDIEDNQSYCHGNEPVNYFMLFIELFDLVYHLLLLLLSISLVMINVIAPVNDAGVVGA